MQTPEEMAREAMGNITGPMRQIFGRGDMSRELLDALDVLVEQEVEHLADLIRARDAEARAEVERLRTALSAAWDVRDALWPRGDRR